MRLAPPISLSWAAGSAASAYSRRVARLKLVLPAIGVGLLLLTAVWPRFAPFLDRMRFAPAIDLREARELRMLNPRYVGTDRQDRPFVVTAAVGRQAPEQHELMSLEAPRGDVRLHSGASLALSADTGMYQAQAQMLDLFGQVTLAHSDGTRFVTPSGRFDIAHNAASGHQPIEGQGPRGSVRGEGFQILDKGDTILFEGRSQVVLTAAKPTGANPTGAEQPAGVPAAVVAAAARAEAEQRAAAGPKAAASAKPRPVPVKLPVKLPVKAKPAAKPAAKKRT